MNSHSISQFIARPLSLVAVLFALTASGPVMAGEGNAGNPGILPPNSHAFGHSYAEWSAIWWQWALSLPAEGHPLLDDTADCSAGQTGHVWFLGGSFGSDPVVRSCTVPVGKALFFPILNTAFFLTDPGDTEEVARAAVNDAIDQVVSVSLTIDGKAVKHLLRYRTDSPLFEVGPLPANNLLGLDEGAIVEAVADGIYVMLAPLSPGRHTIHFTAEGGDGFTQDITYHLTVAPRRR